MKNRRLLIPIGLILVAVLVVNRVRLPLEPKYQEKSLTAWLDEEKDTNRLNVALRKIGSNAIPYLVTWASAEDSAFKAKLTQLTKTLGVIHAESGTEKRWRAVLGFQAIGTNGSPAIPALSNLLQRVHYPREIAFALAGIGRDAIPALVAALRHTNEQVRFNAALALTSLGRVAGEAIPPLLESLKDTSVPVRFQAAEALGCIRSKPQQVTPALIQALQDNQATVRWKAATALSEFGNQAKDAIPKLADLATNDKSSEVRKHCSDAIKRINLQSDGEQF